MRLPDIRISVESVVSAGGVAVQVEGIPGVSEPQNFALYFPHRDTMRDLGRAAMVGDVVAQMVLDGVEKARQDFR